jgi:hypothetical protein
MAATKPHRRRVRSVSSATVLGSPVESEIEPTLPARSKQMTISTAFTHPAFSWLGQPATTLMALAAELGTAIIEIMVESLYLNAGGTGSMAIEFAFDRFEHEGRYLRFEYAGDSGGTRLVTLGSCDE